ncbi:hypothetical protein BCR42DRAFT_412692 [Absidia repens]|uniref:Uncharacterized protein n=1 Tax=Absidia repens TaxID=90262 RepID=A0A1X2IK37_9FUNG|nr:hypothetical protein BCR42DRAFT_412692 [Absidia repens]
MIQRSFSTSIYEQNKSPPPHITTDTLLDKHNSILLPDTLRASVLLRRIGLERSWTQDQVNQDISILDGHRLYTVRDLLSLSDYSWKVIDLLPLVKDLLRSSVDPHWMDNDRKKKPNKKQKNKKTQPISTIGSPVTAGKLTDQAFLPTSPVTLSSSPPSFSNNNNNNNTTITTAGDDKYIKPDESDPMFVDMICDDPLTIRNTLRNLSIFDDQHYDDDDSIPISPTRLPPRRGPFSSLSSTPKNVRFTDRNSIILDTINDKELPIVPPISTTVAPSSSSNPTRRSPDTDSASSFDTATTDEDEEALMTAAAAMVTGRSGSGRRVRHSALSSSSKDQFSTPSTSPIA